MTSEDVRNVTFERGMRGYRAEDVDDFLQMIAKEIDEMAGEKESIEAEKNAALAEKASIQNKIYILAQKVEEYRGQEETLKTALINAQRMGETVVHEAKQKAELIIRDATGKSELLRQQAEEQIAAERRALEQMKEEVSRFKSTILNLYKQHIESLSALDAPTTHSEEFLKEFDESYKGDNVYKGRNEPKNSKAQQDASANRSEPVKPVSEPPSIYETDLAGSLFEGVPIDYEQN